MKMSPIEIEKYFDGLLRSLKRAEKIINLNTGQWNLSTLTCKLKKKKGETEKQQKKKENST